MEGFYENLPFLCHCEARSDVAILKSKSQRYGIPCRSTGARSKKKSLSQKTWDSLRRFASSFFISRFRFATCNHSSFRDGKSFRLRLPRRAQKCALLAMTNLVGFAEKQSNLRNETFERRSRALPPRKKQPQKMKNIRFQTKTSRFSCHCEAAARPWQS